MVIGQAVPEGLAVLPPGPELAALLADLDLSQVPNDDVVDVLIARSRELAHAQAGMFAALAEVVCRQPFAGPLEVRRGDRADMCGADEVRAALSWTRRAAEAETDLAWGLVQELPLVLSALEQGLIDRGKARVFDQHLAGLPAEQIAAVCAAVLPHAPRLTTGQIGERIKRLILELDPAHYERRYRKAVRDRTAVAYLSADGTAVISASGLPADEAAAAWERLDALARAARHDGHPGTLDQIRADLVLGLLDGSLHGLERAEILQALLERFAGHAHSDEDLDRPAAGQGHAGNDGDNDNGDNGDGDGGDSGGDDGDDGSGGSGNDGDGGDGDGGSGDPDPGPGDPGPGSGGPGPRGPSGPGQPGEPEGEGRETGTGSTLVGGASGAGGGSDTPTGPAAGVEPVAKPTAGAAPEPGAPTRRPVVPGRSGPRLGVEVRVPLSTLLGLDDRAGGLPGWGPIPATAARRTVTRQRRAQWRWVIVNTDGHLLAEGLTRHRPGHLTRAGPAGGIVEIHIPEALLATLAATATRYGDWAGVITDIADRYKEYCSQDDPGAELDSRPEARFPGAALRRHTEVRDRSCVHPGCRTSAQRCDQDHTVDHGRGGTTTRDDLAPLCRHHHMLKTEGGWRLDQPAPGRFFWTSPLGRVYPVEPEPILPPPPKIVPRGADPWLDDPAPDTGHDPRPPPA